MVIVSTDPLGEVSGDALCVAQTQWVAGQSAVLQPRHVADVQHAPTRRQFHVLHHLVVQALQLCTPTRILVSIGGVGGLFTVGVVIIHTYIHSGMYVYTTHA
jgi:hypothetical protein